MPGSNIGQMAEKRTENTPPDPAETTPMKRGLQGLIERANIDLAAQIKPGRGVEGERAIKAQRALQMPMIIAAALTLPSLILLETRETGPLYVVSVVLNWGTWLAFRKRQELAVLVEGDARLLNQYGVMPVGPRRHNRTRADQGADCRPRPASLASPARRGLHRPGRTAGPGQDGKHEAGVDHGHHRTGRILSCRAAAEKKL